MSPRDSALVKHQFVPSGRKSYGLRICATCDGLERDSVHKLLPVSAETKEHEARKVGERDGGE